MTAHKNCNSTLPMKKDRPRKRGRLYEHGSNLRARDRTKLKGGGPWKGRIATFKPSTPSEIQAGLMFHTPGSNNLRKR